MLIVKNWQRGWIKYDVEVHRLSNDYHMLKLVWNEIVGKNKKIVGCTLPILQTLKNCQSRPLTKYVPISSYSKKYNVHWL